MRLDAPVKLHDDRLFTAASQTFSGFKPHDLTVCILVGSLTVRVRRRCWAQSVASFQFRLIKELIDVKNFLVSKRLRKLELSETSSYHMYIMPS